MPDFPLTDEQLAHEQRNFEAIAQSRKAIVKDLVHNLAFGQWGCDAGQAHIMAESLAQSFEYDGAQLLYIDEQKNKVPAREARGVIAAQYPFLFSNAEGGDPAATAALEALTSTNLTVRGKWIAAVGDRAKADAVARDYGLRDAIDMRPGTPPTAGAAPAPTSKSASPADNPFAYGGANTDHSGRFTASALAKQHSFYLRDREAAENAMRRAGVSKLGATHAPRPATAA